MFGCHGYGKSISPVSRRMGLGAWQATCSLDGVLRTSLTNIQNGLVVLLPERGYFRFLHHVHIHVHVHIE